MEDIQKAGNECRYGKIPGLEKSVSRMIFGTAIAPMIEGKNADELLDAALAKGINTFDVARGYGRAEESLGGWMKRRDNREQVVVISKCGNCDSGGSVCVNRKVIETELAESLQALQTNYIDIYLLHRDDSKTPVGELIDTLNKLQKTGKIKVFGVSNWTHERIEEANRYAKEHQLQGFSVSSPHFGLAEKKGCTVSQIALAWMFRQNLNMYVLVSTTKAFRLEENLRTFTVELSEEESRYLNAGCKETAFMSK